MISTRGRYALRVMIDLAENISDSNVPLKDIAERQEISKKYLESIVKKLVEDKLIIGASGKNGGYKLARDPEDYSVLEILLSAEGSLSSVACLADKDYDCPRKDRCQTLPMWTEYNEMIYSFWENKKLSELINK